MQLIDDEMLKKYDEAYLNFLGDDKPTNDEDRGPVIAYFKPLVFKNIVEYLTENFNAFSPWSDIKPINTYWFVADYFQGSYMRPHFDRPSCSYSVTINMFQEGPDWPLYVWNNDHHNYEPLFRKPGEGIWYRGYEQYHYRSKTEGKRYRQLMIHWVDEGSDDHNSLHTWINMYQPPNERTLFGDINTEKEKKADYERR